MTGDAKITKGYMLPARYVIHAVGPVWEDGRSNEPELLASCYRRSLELADKAKLKSVAFPCISTGVYDYPIEMAASVAVSTVRDSLASLPGIEDVVFCCFSDGDLYIYKKLLNE